MEKYLPSKSTNSLSIMVLRKESNGKELLLTSIEENSCHK
jgi:hypothetical protein